MQEEQKARTVGERAGLLWAWWRGDPLPTLPPLLDFAIAETRDAVLLAQLMETTAEKVEALLHKGDNPYIARLGTVPVAYGWSATGRTGLGNGRATFEVPTNNRYLESFFTLPAWRGLGIYPRLLQAILRNESHENSRFWIIHQSQNDASEHGISKAGFQLVSNVHFSDNDTLCLVCNQEERERAEAGAALLGLPLLTA